MSHPHDLPLASPRPAAGSGPEIDPICGMIVDPLHAAGSHAYRGKTYYFCSTHCLAKFKIAPQRYADGTAPRQSMAEVVTGGSITP